ncbi:hypothetical protein OROGR_006296 [Orobanche gracilis]
MATTSSNMSGSPIADAESSAVAATAAAAVAVAAAAAAYAAAAATATADAESAAAAATAASADAVADAADAASAAAEDTANADAAAAIAGAAAGNQAVWKRPNMRGSKCSINGYVRLGIVKTIIVELSSVGEDTIREQQSGDALKVAKVGPDSMGELSMGGHSYQILVTYLREIPIEVPVGLDPSYHFYGNIYAIMIWACEAIPSLGSKCGNILGASFIQRPRCTRWKLKKLGPVAFTTFFDDQIDSCALYTQDAPIQEGGHGGGKGKGKGKGRARDGDSSGRERIVRQRTSSPVISDPPYFIAGRESSVEPHEHVHIDAQRRSSPIRGSHQTASSSARGTEETAHITDLDTLFTQLRQYVDSTAQQIYRYIDTTAQETRRHIDTTAEETRRRMEELFATTQWPFRDIDEFMRSSPHDGSVPTGPRVAQTESIPTDDVQGLDHRSLVTTVTPSIIPPPPSLDHQSSVPTITPSVIPAEMLVTAPEIVPKTRPSSSSADLIPIAFDYATVASRADTYYSPRLQYRSYRPHSPFSSTVVRKRKDLDEEAYCRWLDSDESVNVGAACGASASWFLMLHDGSKLIDAEHLDAYMGILQFDPAFFGVRWLDDWAHQTALVHTSFLATCINVWNNRKRRKGLSMIDSDDLAFLVSHVHGLRPFWGDHRPWWELRVDHLEYVSIVLVRTLGSSPHSFRGECHLHARFFGAGTKGMVEVKRSTINGIVSFDSYHSTGVVIAKKDECYIQDDATSCGAFAIRTLESLIQGSFSHGKTETDIYAFRGRMARAIWRFSDDADSVVCDLTSLFIPVDDVH